MQDREQEVGGGRYRTGGLGIRAVLEKHRLLSLRLLKSTGCGNGAGVHGGNGGTCGGVEVDGGLVGPL